MTQTGSRAPITASVEVADSDDQEHIVRLVLPDAILTAIATRAATLAPSAPPALEPWVGAAGAAAHLDCTVRRIYDLAEQKRIPHRKEGKFLKFRLSRIDAWLEG